MSNETMLYFLIRLVSVKSVECEVKYWLRRYGRTFILKPIEMHANGNFLGNIKQASHLT